MERIELLRELSRFLWDRRNRGGVYPPFRERAEYFHRVALAAEENPHWAEEELKDIEETFGTSPVAQRDLKVIREIIS